MQLGYNISMKCDVLIIGAGPAGLSAGIFTSRAGLNTICVEKLGVGGQASLSYEIANYPAFQKISGFELTDKMLKHALASGMELVYGEVLSLKKEKNHFLAKLKNSEITAKKVIIACGSKVRKLGLKNEEKLTGRGVSYCASCDGNFFKNKVVAVVGGGNTAIENVTYLSPLVKKVYLIHRSEQFKANAVDVKKVGKMKNVEIVTRANVSEIIGKDKLDKIKVNIAGEIREIVLDGIFVSIGYVPDLSFCELDLECDSAGYIRVDENMNTSVKNCYAAGDIISKNFRQVITACADGAIAGNSCVGVR